VEHEIDLIARKRARHEGPTTEHVYESIMESHRPEDGEQGSDKSYHIEKDMNTRKRKKQS